MNGAAATRRLQQLAADFGSAPLVVVTALTGLPAVALNAALPDSRQQRSVAGTATSDRRSHGGLRMVLRPSG